MGRSARSTAVVPQQLVADGLLIGLAVGLIVLAVVISSPPIDIGPGWRDDESMMRLVAIRDSLAGGNWLDSLQARLGTTGLTIGWSRLVDYPVAMLIVVADPLFGRTGAEVFALTFWPALVMFAFGIGVGEAARAAGGLRAALIALALLLLSPELTQLFSPGRIGAPAVQTALFAVALAGLVRADRSTTAAAWAGAAAATALVAGLSMLGPALILLAVPTLLWVGDGERWRRGLVVYAAGFALAFIAGAAATIPPAGWSMAVCDAVSPALMLIVGTGAGALALAAFIIRSRPGDGVVGVLLRGGTVLGLACLLVTLTAVAAPTCLAGLLGHGAAPTGPVWPGSIAPAGSFGADAIGLLARHGATAAALLLGAAALIAVRPVPRRLLPIATLVVASVAGATIDPAIAGVTPIATAVLGGAVAAHFAERFAGRDDIVASLAKLSFLPLAPMVWLSAAALIVDGDPGAPPDRAEEAAIAAACRTDLVGALGDLPPGLVAADPDAGPALLLSTGHRVLAAPVPRGAEGRSLVEAIATGPAGRELAARVGVDYLGVCRAAHEGRGGDGLFARLSAGETPAGIEVVARTPVSLVARLVPIPHPDHTGSLSAPRLRPSLLPLHDSFRPPGRRR